MKRTAITGASLALLCVVFTAIYEHFSHGAASPHMRAMFLMPLVGVALPALICFLTPLHRFVGRLPFNLWNSGMATWVAVCSAVSSTFRDGTPPWIFPTASRAGSFWVLPPSPKPSISSNDRKTDKALS